MYWILVPEFHQDVLLSLLLQEKRNISPSGNHVISSCNHEDADTCFV